MSNFFNDSIFWIEVDKVKPNPYQPRREFDPVRLQDLSESIRMYGILQPLVVTRSEVITDDGGLAVEYELISGERRLRASKLAGLREVPAIIRSNTEDAKVKLELAIIENLQREDLNVVERARAFQRLVDDFNFTHAQIGVKVGKSRVYVTNSLRVLGLPEEILNALSEGKISEGHTRPLLMLETRPEEQLVVFKEIMFKKLTVREAEQIGRKIAFERARKKERMPDPELVEIEGKLAESLGTRVHVERKDNGGQLVIDFFTNDDLREIMELLKSNQKKSVGHMINKFEQSGEHLKNKGLTADEALEEVMQKREDKMLAKEAQKEAKHEEKEEVKLADDRPLNEVEADNESEDLYSIKNFSV